MSQLFPASMRFAREIFRAVALTAALATPSVAAESLRVAKVVPFAWTFTPLDIGIQTGIFAKHGLDIEAMLGKDNGLDAYIEWGKSPRERNNFGDEKALRGDRRRRERCRQRHRAKDFTCKAHAGREKLAHASPPLALFNSRNLAQPSQKLSLVATR